jgi:hypothetical protein
MSVAGQTLAIPMAALRTTRQDTGSRGWIETCIICDDVYV